MRPAGPERVGQEAFLGELLDRFVEDLQEGRTSELEAVLSGHPDLEEQIRETFFLAREIAPRPIQIRVEGYTILRELGRGGMGTVYLARQESLGRLVALKVLSPSLGLSERARARFLHEARTLASLKDDRIVRIHEVLHRDDLTAYAMEWVEGKTLRQAIDDLRAVGPEASIADLAASLGAEKALGPNLMTFLVGLGLTLARALAEVHACGLVHRDVKPSNILIRRDGSVLLADFGLARGPDSSFTRAGGFVGTPVYASPEQFAEPGVLDGRSDVYSLGVTLYEALARVHPFGEGAGLQERIERGEGLPLRKLAPWAPRDLETILCRAMEPDRARRYATAGELADDLERLLRFQPIRARPVGLGRRLVKLVRRNRTAVLGAAAGALAVAALLIPLLGGGKPGPDAGLEVAALVRAARLELVGPESRERAWYQLALGRKPEQAGIAIRGLGIQKAVALYERALALDPEDRELQWEAEVAGLAQEIGRSDYASIQRRVECLAAFCPTTAATVRRTYGSMKDCPETEIEAASLAERKALGLLAFLTGDVTLCEKAWGRLDPVGLGFPLVDAGLGVLYLADNRPGRASDRLLAAVEAFPDSPFLMLQLAHAALEREDPDAFLAERWLVRAEASMDPRLRELSALVRGDLRRLKGDLAGACRDYMDLCAMEPRIPMGELRLAQVALHLGEEELGRSRLAALVQAWPAVARFRKALVEACLQAGDPRECLVQARHVLSVDFGAGRSPGTRRDLLWILGACGLKGLLERGIADMQSGEARPLWSFPRPSGPFASREHVEALFERLDGFEKDGRLGMRVPPMVSPERNLAEVLSVLVRFGIYFPEAWTARASLAGAGALAGANWARVNWEKVCEGITKLVQLVDRTCTGRPPPEPLFEFWGDRDNERGERCGVAVSGVGDLDGDGHDDILVGASHGNVGTNEEPVYAGLARVYSGKNGRILYVLKGRSRNDQFGFSVSRTGDVDGDGRPDFLVSAKCSTVESTLFVGRVILFSGRTGNPIRELQGDPGTPGGLFGFSVGCAGDVDGDGIPDIVAGANAANANRGYVLVLSGKDGGLIWRFEGKAKGDWFGQVVDGAGDVDNDGFADVIVGAGQFKTTRIGYAEVYSGGTGRVLHSLTGKSAGDLFHVVSGAGDLDQDGYADFMVGAPGEERLRGVVRVYSGRTGGILQRFEGLAAGDQFGTSLKSAGDVDRDGVPDIIVGAHQALIKHIQSQGYAVLYSGATGNRICLIPGPSPKSWFGGGYPGVDAAGDVDGDGHADLVIGANQWFLGSRHVGPGFARVYSGRLLFWSRKESGLRPAWYR